MRAAAFRTPGPPEVLEIVELCRPKPGLREVLVDVASTALNHADLYRRSGVIAPTKIETVLGLEFAGTVAELGAGVTELEVGQPVMGRVTEGAYAEAVVVHERLALPVPASLSVSDAAAVPLAWMTAYEALVAQARLKMSETVLIHAGASGVGTAAIQLARAMNGFVIVTASADKCTACEAIGAHHALNRAAGDVFMQIADITAGRGCDVILDLVGGPKLSKNVELLRPRGRLVIAGLLDAPDGSMPLGRLLTQNGSVLTTNLGANKLEDRIFLAQCLRREVLPLFDIDRASAIIDRRFPFEQIADAHAYLETGRNVGKVVINISDHND